MRRVARFPLVRIAIGLAVCYIPLLIVNLLVLKPISQHLALSDRVGRALRFGINILLLLGAYYLFLRRTEERTEYRWNTKTLPRDFLVGMALAVLAISMVIVVLSVTGHYQLDGFTFNGPMILYLLLVFGFMSVLEEVLFRGVVYRVLEESTGTILALVTSAVLFGSPHLFNQDSNVVSLVAASIGGILLGLMFTLTRNIWMPIAFHFMWNFAQTAAGSPLSGSEEFIMDLNVRAQFVGPDWLTGGEAGVENSIITIGITVMIALALYLIDHRKGLLVPRSWPAMRRPSEELVAER